MYEKEKKRRRKDGKNTAREREKRIQSLLYLGEEKAGKPQEP